MAHKVVEHKVQVVVPRKVVGRKVQAVAAGMVVAHIGLTAVTCKVVEHMMVPFEAQ